MRARVGEERRHDGTRTQVVRRAVYAYGIAATGMALGSAALVVLRIAVVHALCTLCLGSALISFVRIAPAWTLVVVTWKERKRR